MKKFGKTLVMLICVTGLVVTFGCSMLQDLAMPIHVGDDAVLYSEQPATSYLPWTTVFDAKRIKSYIDYQHLDLQAYYDDVKAQDLRQYNFLTGRVTASIADARQFQQKLFNPNGSVGMAITALFGGTIGALFINTGKKKVA